MGTRALAAALAAATALAFLGCVGDAPALSSADAGDLTGTESNPCYPNDSCNAGLSCVSGTCVSLDASDAASDAGGGSDAESDASDASTCLPKGTIGIQTKASANGDSGVKIINLDPGSCPNRLLLVGFSSSPNGLAAGITVSFGAQGLTAVGNSTALGDGNNTPGGYYTCTSKIFVLANPTGIANVTATFGGVGGNPVSAAIGAVVLYNVDLGNSPTNVTTVNGKNAAMSITIPTAAGRMVFANDCNYSTVVNIGSGDEQWLETGGKANGAGSTLLSTGSSAIIGWNQSSAYAWSASGVDIVPAP